jgi:hypothetical protein
MKITEEMIRLKAYELWEEGGRAEGTAEKDWLNAELLLKKNRKKGDTGRQAPPIGLRQLKS